MDALSLRIKLNGGWSPARSLVVQWPNNEQRYYKAECVFDLEVCRSQGNVGLEQNLQMWESKQSELLDKIWRKLLAKYPLDGGMLQSAWHAWPQILQFVSEEVAELRYARAQYDIWQESFPAYRAAVDLPSESQ